VTPGVAHERRVALAQFFGVMAVVVGVVWVGLYLTHRPGDRVELRIAIGELRSEAAETAVVAREYAAGSLDGRFVGTHAGQLANSTEAAYRTLAELDVLPDLVPIKTAALDAERELVAAVTDLRAGQEPSADQTAHLRDGLAELEGQLGH